MAAEDRENTPRNCVKLVTGRTDNKMLRNSSFTSCSYRHFYLEILILLVTLPCSANEFYYVTGFPYHFFEANQQKVDVKILP